MCSVLGKTATQAADMGLSAEDDPCHSFDYVCIIHKQQPVVNNVSAHHLTFEEASLTAADQDMLLYSDGACYGNCSSSDSSESSDSSDSELQLDGGRSSREVSYSQTGQCLPQLPDNELEVVAACDRSKEACSNCIARIDAAVSTGAGSCSSVPADPVQHASPSTRSAMQTGLTRSCTAHQQQRNDTMPGLDVAAKPLADVNLCISAGVSDSAGLAGTLENAGSSEVVAAGGSSTQGSCSVFFARVPPTVPYESIKALFEQFGKVKLLNLFRPWASAKTSKGCGILEYEDPAAAVAAMKALHTKYHWTGGETTMVVEWMDPARPCKDKASPGPGGKSGTPKGSQTAKAAAIAKAVKGGCGQRNSGTPRANTFTANPSGLSSGTSSLPHSFGSGYTLVAIPNSLSAHCKATRAGPLAAEAAGDTAWLLHADLAAAEAAVQGCLPQCGGLGPAATGSGDPGQIGAGQLLGGGLAGRAAARSGRGVVALPGKAGLLGTGNEGFATARGAGLPSHCQATPLYASSAPNPLRLAHHPVSHWDLTPPPSRERSALPLCSADLAAVSWQQDTPLLSSLADSCMASSLNSVCAHQQAGCLSQGLPGVAAMFPAAACDGNLPSELQAMQQLVDALNSQPVHGSVCDATAPGSGPVRPVSRLLHLSNGPNELLRSRLAQASHGLCHEAYQVQQSFAGAPMAAVDALLLANKSSGNAGIPAVGTTALIPSSAQQQLQAPLAAAGIAGVLQTAQVPASDLHFMTHPLTRPLGSVGCSLLGSGSGHGYLNVTGAEPSSSPVPQMNQAAIPAPTYGPAKPSCCLPSACLGSFSGVGSIGTGDVENSMVAGFTLNAGYDDTSLFRAQQQLLQQQLLQQQLAQQANPAVQPMGTVSSGPAENYSWANLLL